MPRTLAVALLALGCAREQPDEPVGTAPLDAAANPKRVAAPTTSAAPEAVAAPATSPPESAPSPASASASVSARRTAPCVVPTPDTPPAKATKAKKCPPDPGPKPTLPSGQVRFVGAAGKPRVNVEIAREPGQQARGLMYRTSMPPNDGMLFSYPSERDLAFWMKNTCIPLDMLFLAKDGTIVGILEEVPVLNLQSRSVDCRAQHVLELNAGYCRRHGIKAGMRVEIDER